MSGEIIVIEQPLLPLRNPLLEDLWAFTKTETLLTAFELGLFNQLIASQADTPKTLQTLAKELHLEETSLKRLCNLLQTWGYVTINLEQTTVTPTPQTVALFGSEAHQAGWLAYATYIRQVQAAWGGLTTTLKQGTPTGTAFSLVEAEARFSNLNEGLRLLYEPLAETLFNALLPYMSMADSQAALHCVDVGSGSGVWSLPFLKAFPHATVTCLDYPSVLAQAEASTALAPFKDRMRLIACDFESTNLEWCMETITHAQVVLMANVLRELSQEGQLDLLKKAGLHLATGGVMVIIETLKEGTPQQGIPLVYTVTDLHLLATSFSSTGCLTKTALIQLCETAFEESAGIDLRWLDLEAFRQQGLSVVIIQKQLS